MIRARVRTLPTYLRPARLARPPGFLHTVSVSRDCVVGVFRVLPRRWVVERTFAWLGQSRRLARDCERLPATSEAVIDGAMSRLMLRRLTRPAV